MVGKGEKLHTVKVSAPGKVILHGEHSVVYGTTAIAASLGLRSSIVIKENDRTDLINIYLPGVNVEESFKIPVLIEKLFKPSLENNITWNNPEKVDHEAHLKLVDRFLNETKPEFDDLKSNQKNALRGILYVMSGILGSRGDIKSMDISLASELTIGAGTGSSASYAVVLAGALIRLVKVKSKTEDAEAQKLGEDFSADEKQIISSWAFNIDRMMHGTPSGIDNATCTFGAVVSFRKGAAPRVLDVHVGVRVLLVDTRVARETRVVAARVAALRSRNMAAVEHVMAAIDVITHNAIRVLENLSAQPGKGGDEESQYRHLAELWNMNHCLLGALGASHPSLERIRASAVARDLACKLTGAGGGGYAMVLIPPSTEHGVVDDLTDELTQHGYRVQETSLGGAGVKVDI